MHASAFVTLFALFLAFATVNAFAPDALAEIPGARTEFKDGPQRKAARGVQMASICESERAALMERSKAYQVTLPTQREIQLGDSVEVTWQWGPTSYRLGTPERFIEIYLDMPESAEVLDAKSQPVRMSADSAGAASPYARPVLDGERRKRFSLGSLTYESGGKLRIRPTKSGPLRLFAQIEVTPFSGRTYSRPDCPAMLLSETAPVIIDVKAPQRFAEARTCHIDGANRLARSLGVQVGLDKANEQGVRFGESVKLRWSVASPINTACKTPLYLVLSMPDRVRFSGDGFFALMPSTMGPFKIAHQSDKVRVFVPLHIGEIARTGTLGLSIYQGGEFKIDWDLIEIPSFTASPTALNDFAPEQALVVRPPDSPLTLNVLPGRPRIVVQDRFTIEKPIRSVYSSNGDYELQVFAGFYRVLDGRSNELIVERDGREPNFSATARFVHALLENDTDIEVIDLYSRATIFGGTRERSERSSSVGGVGAVAWGRGDSFTLLAAGGGGHAFMLNTLLDRAATAIDSGSYKAPVDSNVDLRIDLEAMTVINAPSPENGWRDSTTHHSLLEPQADDGSWQPNEAGERAQGTKRRYQRAYALFPLTQPKFTGNAYRWDLGDQLLLSYPRYCGACPPGWESMSVGELMRGFKPTPPDYYQTHADRQQWVEAQKSDIGTYHSMMVRHSSVRTSQRVASIEHATVLPHQERSLLRKELARSSAGAANVARRALTRVADMTGLSFRDLQPTVSEGGRIAEYTMDGKGGRRMVAANRDPQLERALKAHATSSAYKRALQRFEGGNPDYYRTGRLEDILGGFSCAGGGGNDPVGQFVVPMRIEGRRSWRSGTTSIWLLQQHCIPGSSVGTSSAQLGVLVAREGKGAQYIPLKDDLGVDSVTSEGGTTTILKSWLSDDDVLLVAGPNRALLVYDVKARKRIAYIRNAPEADVASSIHLTRDRSTLLQVNENGRLFVYRLRDQKRLISGYYIDDEIVLHQDDGYYMATPEGAHFINLAFPGVEGHFSFQQFDKTLNRPDIVRAALAGNARAPAPKLGVPPTLRIEASTTETPGDRVARLRYRAASMSNLQRLHVYVDGRPVADRELSGGAADAVLSVPLAPEARWISAVAVDDRGHESSPQTHALSEPRGADGKLFAIAVGTDRYEDPSIKTLGAAKRDAKAFADAMIGLKGSTYQDVDVTPLLDERHLQRRLPERLSEIVAAAGPNDTIMLFAAGHGTQGRDGKFYLVTPTTREASLETTALGWDAIAATLDKAKARIVVFLDACRSGSVGRAGSNDAAVTSLLQRSAAITVVAAAKGRQDSLETDGGGYFTNALVAAVTSARQSTDSNNNGAVELAELYGVVKREVVAATKGNQTPWIARNHMVGEIPLF